MARALFLATTHIGILFSSASATENNSQNCWVFFTDKMHPADEQGFLPKESASYRIALGNVSSRAIARRSKVLPEHQIMSVHDLPVHESYLDAVRGSGARLRHTSRWLNAASFLMTGEQRVIVERLPFVRSVKPVSTFLGWRKEDGFPDERTDFFKPASLDYGPSYEQLNMIDAIRLHDMGVTGSGVLVGMLDSGFRWRNHEALRGRRVVGERDFIFGDDTTSNQTPDVANQDEHGTLTFSLIGGLAPGRLIGAAFDAEFLLGKTEFIPSETQIEEDDWVAGLEWMESRGADVVSSSLGYNAFDDGSSYDWDSSDFDGRTSITARGAAHAARLGVVVCTAMGNEGNGDGIRGTMLTPADADSILSIGAVNFSRRLPSFSSTGPTNDLRIKPDLAAPGAAGVQFALPPGPDTYGRTQQGTSLSTPLAAGAAALLLSARPELTPIQVRDALRSTAIPLVDPLRYPFSPNNFTGWGLVQAFEASLSFGPVFSNSPTVTSVSGGAAIASTIVSRSGVIPDSVFLYVASGGDSAFRPHRMSLVTPSVFPTSGVYSTTITTGGSKPSIRMYLEARDSSGQTYRSPAPSRAAFWRLADFMNAPVADGILQNFPNPFSGGTTLRYQLATEGRVTISIYTVLGERVAMLLDRVEPPGSDKSVWFDSSNLVSGVYIARLSTPDGSFFGKLMVVR